MLIGRLDESPVRRPRVHDAPSADAFPAWLTDIAINRLQRRFPGESAVTIMTRGQQRLFTTVAVAFAALMFAAPLDTMRVLAALGTLFFSLVVSLRVVACINILALLPTALLRRKPAPGADGDLPVYTILVPLFREANVLEPLVDALRTLDYPPGKLDIKLVLERIDTETREAARRLDLPPQFEIVVVPDSLPRTKPKALNYALQMARGDFVVVYDAEDRPAPDQLRKALAAFSAGPPNLACIQARLTIYNGAENWLTNGIR